MRKDPEASSERTQRVRFEPDKAWSVISQIAGERRYTHSR